MPRQNTPVRQPLVRPPDLFALMPLCGVDDFTGSLGAIYRCPLCNGRRPETKPEDEVPPIETLRIHVNVHNEVVVRCHRCGLAGSALELVRRHGSGTWSRLVERLEESRVFGYDPIPEDWIKRAKDWERFDRMFEKSKAFCRQLVQSREIQQLCFGETGLCSAIQLERILPGVRLVSKWGKPTMFLVELRRSILGLPTHVLIRHRKKGGVFASYAFQPLESVELWMPEWVPYRDWSEEMIYFTDLRIAEEITMALKKHPSGVAPPVAWIAECRGPVADEMPYRAVQYLPTEDEGPELALAFAQPGINSIVRGRDAVERVADHIIERTQNTDPIPYLQAVLQKPWIIPAVEQRLTQAVCERLGPGAADMVSSSGASDRVLPCEIRGTTYLCRNGIYVKRKGKQDWQPCTNFSLRIEEQVMGGEEPFHRILLLMEAGSEHFNVTEEELQDGKKLLQKAVAAANAGVLQDLPRVLDPLDLKRLPQIVQTTQLKPPVQVTAPSVLGFDKWRFHGPNFTATANGISFQTPTLGVDGRTVCSMLPERTWVSETDHLFCEANQLAGSLTGLVSASRRMLSVVLNAALAWLHRASRGLPSYLLLPSEAHLEVLGRLIGVVPIDVGRGAVQHPWVPRLMRSSYWRPEQFEKHGQVVAALEDRHRKVDPAIPIVVHHWDQGDPPVPTGVLSLLTHCVLGSRDVSDARKRLVSLVECPEVRGRFSGALDLATAYLAESGGYLDAFLSAVHLLPRPDDYWIQKGEKTLLKREIVTQLNEQRGFGFRETRLIQELRERYPFEQPDRYGREQIPVFRLPGEKALVG